MVVVALDDVGVFMDFEPDPMTRPMNEVVAVSGLVDDVSCSSIDFLTGPSRCHRGVVFSDSAKEVEAMFVLVGSRDERNFHLRCLMAIAEIAQAPAFRERWRNAATPEDLRDLLLLSTRRRQHH